MFAPHPSVVLSTFSLFDFAKQMTVVRQARKGVPSPRVVVPCGTSTLGVSFVSFSFRLFCERKAAKKFWYLMFVPQTDATSYPLSTFSLGQEPQRKSSQKETAIFCTHAVRASAFEKAEQNNRLVRASKVEKTTVWFVRTRRTDTNNSKSSSAMMVELFFVSCSKIAYLCQQSSK